MTLHSKKRAYSDERLAQISAAVQRIIAKYNSVNSAAKDLNIPRTNIQFWRDQKAGPSPFYMQMLYDHSRDDAFLLQDEETVVFIETGLCEQDGTPIKPKAGNQYSKKKIHDPNEIHSSAIRFAIKHYLGTDRIDEILLALKKWNNYLNGKGNKERYLREKVGITLSAVHKWLKFHETGDFPSLGTLIKLYRATQIKQFLLTREERQIPEVGKIVFPVDYPAQEDYTKQKKVNQPSVPAKPAQEPEREVVFDGIHQVEPLGLLSVAQEEVEKAVHQFVISIDSTAAGTKRVMRLCNVSELPENTKRKVAQTLVRLAATFGITASDLDAYAEPETDPAVMKRLTDILG